MGDGFIGVVGGLHISHFVSTPSVKGYSVKMEEPSRRICGLRMRSKEPKEEQQNTNPIRISIYRGCGGVIGRRKSNLLACISLLEILLWGRKMSRFQEIG